MRLLIVDFNHEIKADRASLPPPVHGCARHLFRSPHHIIARSTRDLITLSFISIGFSKMTGDSQGGESGTALPHIMTDEERDRTRDAGPMVSRRYIVVGRFLAIR